MQNNSRLKKKKHAKNSIIIRITSLNNAHMPTINVHPYGTNIKNTLLVWQ